MILGAVVGRENNGKAGVPGPLPFLKFLSFALRVLLNVAFLVAYLDQDTCAKIGDNGGRYFRSWHSTFSVARVPLVTECEARWQSIRPAFFSGPSRTQSDFSAV